ncbi:GntR family transcriptional regulator [Agrococcus sp. SGAir0287]|uniref:GntR family transcriptional regulator n=1 Tax=Agrococcus sp. SGAir0287 TaxID=2070347 RepID=UPI0010CCF0C4|nr:GntR family transcriptional regulator [Agrococcus sp. SGAir0287]QCR20497.1 FadR family transcriptional regulator [Agrococcus sp. SGAir0287]
MEQPATLARSAVFAPIDELGRTEAVTARLEEAIVLGMLHPGERLPAESRLAERFGVAPATVREALADLRERRLVTTQRGRRGGSFVTLDDADRVAAMEDRIVALSSAELADLGVHAVAIAGTGAALAAEEASAFEAAALARDLVGIDFDDELAARRGIGGLHLQVVALSRSVRLVREQVRFQHADGPLLWASLHDADERAAARAGAELLVGAIRDGDAGGARAQVEAACDRTVRWLLEAKRRLA